MLDNLREMIEYDNQIEEIQDLMLEGTDSDMMDFFIDEDGEADIPDDELGKILNKIPEYDEDKELNKKLSRITEAYIPESEILTEGKKLDEFKKSYKQADLKTSGDVDSQIYDDKVYAKQQALVTGIGFVTATALMGFNLPSIAIAGIAGGAGAGAGSYVGGKIGSKILKKRINKYTKGEKITRKTVTDLVDSCQTKKDIKKVEKWVRLLYSRFKSYHADDPEMMRNSEEWKLWLNKEIINKRIPAKKEQIKKNSAKSVKEEYCPNYAYMTEEEFANEMEYEASLYDYDNEDYVEEAFFQHEKLRKEIKNGYFSEKQLRNHIANIEYFDEAQNLNYELQNAVVVLKKMIDEAEGAEKKKYQKLLKFVENDARKMLDSKYRQVEKDAETKQEKRRQEKKAKKENRKKRFSKAKESYELDIEFPEEY